MISLVFAMGRNRVIGSNNSMPWRLPADLAYFKDLTMGSTVVMGRKTFESIGKPLKGRKNIVLTRDRRYIQDGCFIAHSLEEVLDMTKGEQETFVIGGAEVYSMFLPYAKKLYMTYIDHEFQGDTYFPEIDYDEWKLVSKVMGEKNEKNPYHYFFQVYERI
jgi:dihydrofolate reductase